MQTVAVLQILKLPTQQIYLTYSKLNMDEICGLKSHLSYVHMYNTKVFIEIHPCAKEVIFITEFTIWDHPFKTSANFHDF